MTQTMRYLAFIGTLMIVAGLGIAILTENSRQQIATENVEMLMLSEGLDLYAQNCVVCHGASGEGIATYPTLTNADVMDSQELYKVIERGRYNTAMAAFSLNEGGIFTGMQIESLVLLLQAHVWDSVNLRVAALGLTPPQIAVAEIPAETFVLVETLPDGTTLASGLSIYAENCVACHGANGEGSSLAPALNTDELRVRLSDADIARIVGDGVAGTLMASWNAALDSQQQASVVSLLSRWGELNALGVRLPLIETLPLNSSPETIANGQRLYSLVCTQCHGIDGYGTPLAPALNNQTFLSQTPDAAIQQIIAGGISGTKMPAWAGYLTDLDIAAITSYLRSLEATAPIVAPVQP